MTTINDELWNLIIAFRSVRIDTARLDAELLVMDVLGLDRTHLLLNQNDEMSAEHQRRLAELANRRLEGESIAYILGKREFFGLDFDVSPDVLVPRPETELLVEWALKWLVARANSSVIDVGTGSGAIAVSIAANTPVSTRITASDVSVEALDVARRNAERHVPGRIEFIASDLLADVDGSFDLVLANLPYLRPDQIDGNRSIAAEPRLALDGGLNGAEIIYRLIDQIAASDPLSSAIMLEVDPANASPIAGYFASVTTCLPD